MYINKPKYKNEDHYNESITNCQSFSISNEPESQESREELLR